MVLTLTLVFGFAIAAVSYALVESPCREALRGWDIPQGAGGPPAPPMDVRSAAPEPAVAP